MITKTRARRLLERLQKKMRRGYRGQPVGTVAFYGPNDRIATKVVVSVTRGEKVEHLQKWFAETDDVRDSRAIMQSVVDFLEEHGAATFTVTPGIYGCPHEEGVDYPDGGVCPACPYWADHDREAIFDA